MNPLHHARADPPWFMRQVLGWQPWAKQAEIAQAIRSAISGQGPKRIAVRSGNGVGKTAIAARIMLWALRCVPNCVVITTAPTNRQVNELLWREARDAYNSARIKLGGRFYSGAARWDLTARRYALGISPEGTRPEKFQGFHADTLLFILDEASGIPPAHWEAIKGSALAGNTVIFAIGNPTRTSGEFFDAFHSKRDLWQTMHINSLDSPNFHGANIPGLVGPAAVEEARRDWGEDSVLWQVRILGNFPTASSDALIPLAWLEDAETVPAAPGPTALGVDVARSGADETAFALMHGNELAHLTTWRGQDTMRTAGAVKTIWDDHHGRISIAIDDGGVGGGVVDRLRELDIPVYDVKFGGRADTEAALHFKNKLAEMYWALRTQLQAHQLRLPQDLKLQAQLTGIEWAQESDRTIRVYKKGKDEGKPSPDRADALILAVEALARATRTPGGLFL